MANRLSDEIINKIPILYKQLNNKSEVARQLGISVASVNKYLTVVNAAPTEKKSRTKVTPELIEKINEEYTKCKNITEVEKNLNIYA